MKKLQLKKLTGAWKDRAGGVFIFVAIAAPVLIGIAGAAIDVGMWYATKRLAQSASDSAAMAAALESVRSGGDPNAITAAAVLDAANHGYSAANGDTIDVTPQAGSRVEVTITRPTQGLLSQVVFTDQTDVSARAVARAVLNNSCVWSLSPTEPQAINVVGSAEVNLGCGMIARTSDPDGIHKEGSGCVTATEYLVVGGYDDSLDDCPGGGLDPTPETGIPPADDPLASLPSPPVGSCSGMNTNLNGGGVPDPTVIPAGTYCSNIRINTSSQVIFGPGLIVLNGAHLQINAVANVTGTDVSFYATSTSTGFDIQGTPNITLSADPGGPLPGILFYQDRNTPSGITHILTGGSTMQLDGIIYTPSTDVMFAGGTSADSSSVMIIADEVEFKGGDTFLGDFDTSSILSNPLMIRPQLLE